MPEPAAWWSGDRRWSIDGFPPRTHNLLTPLVDGQAAFQAMLDAIRGAKDYVYITGWTITPAFVLDPDTPEGVLVAVLAEVSQRVQVKILVWSGSLMLFPPSHRVNSHMRDTLLQRAPRVDFRLDHWARPTHCHHQKALVVDGQVGFVGGLDLTTLEADRWDVPGHPVRTGPNWHDAMLQIQGEAVADLESNFVQRWSAVTGEREIGRRQPESKPEWSSTCQIIRTIPRHVYHFAWEGEYGIAHAYLAAIAQAKRFVYIENQYLWSPEIVDALIAAMERNASTPFRVVLIIPAKAHEGKFDNDQHVEQLRAADRGRHIVSVYTLYTGGHAAGLAGFTFKPVYVHAKVAIIDDEWYTVGSANLNQRGLATDTEMNAQALDASGALALRLQLWSEHLGTTVAEIQGRDPIDVIDHDFRERAAQVEKVVGQGWGSLPAQLYPYQIGRMPGSWVLQELEALVVQGL